MTDPNRAHSSDAADPVAEDIASRNTDTADVVAGEQVLEEGAVAPEPDELADDAAHDRRHAADERTDAGAPPPQEEPG